LRGRLGFCFGEVVLVGLHVVLDGDDGAAEKPGDEVFSKDEGGSGPDPILRIGSSFVFPPQNNQ
jgi:hypothetical protein